MSPAGQAVVPPNCYVGQLPAALQAFPSPASGSLDSPTLSKTLTGSCTSAHRTSRSWLPDAADIVLTLPDDVYTAPIMTPLPTGMTEVADSDMELLVGGALAPVQTSPPQQSPPRIGPGLRLPSFEALGIAAPHPDRFGLSRFDSIATGTPAGLVDAFPRGALRSLNDFNGGGVGGLLGSAEDAHAGEPSGGRATLSPVHHFVTVLTPPAEGGAFNWNSIAQVASAPMDSPFSDPGLTALSLDSAPTRSPGGLTAGNASSISVDSAGVDEPHAWIEGAIESLRTSLDPRSPCFAESNKCSWKPTFRARTKQSPSSSLTRAAKSIGHWAHLFQHSHCDPQHYSFLTYSLDQCIPRYTRPLQPRGPANIATGHARPSRWR